MGRTKIITVHSGIWLKNSTDRRLRFRLHVPITSLVAPAGQDVGGHQPQLASDVTIGPLQPDAGPEMEPGFRAQGTVSGSDEGHNEGKAKFTCRTSAAVGISLRLVSH